MNKEDTLDEIRNLLSTLEDLDIDISAKIEDGIDEAERFYWKLNN